MLTSEIVVPYLKLGLISFTGKDANGNFINEPGETVTLNFSLRNYMQCYGSENVDVTLMTDDPDITIIDGTGTVNIPPDNFFSIENQFEIQVGLNAQSHFAEFTLYFDADIPITVGEAINFSVLVAPSGIFVFEGEENSRDYSGTLTAGFLDHLGYNYTYSNTYPATLLGFETAFLSHGNFGQNLDKGTMFTEDHSLKVQEFLEHSGKVYVEMGGMFYRMSQAGYQNLAQMKQLFGVNAYTNPMLENPVDTLLGVENTPMEGMMFTRSDQLFNWYIDKLFPTSGALVPFDENNYGNVAVMNDGSATYGHKTFYMGYSLAGLRDRDATSSGYNVLLKTMEFFGYSPPQGFILSNFIADKTIGGPPLAVQFTDISISDPVYPVISWQWDFENDDTIDSDDQNPARIFDEAGTFDVKLITSNGLNSDTLIVEACVTINSGYLVYEGVASGNDYSGSFIRDYLQENEYPVTYRNILPDDLEGFTAVFLSFGNYLSGNTILNNQMAGVIKAYLEGGGYVYLEGSNALGYDQAGDDQLHQLFGLAAAFDGAANPIDFLAGQPGSLTHEMQFTGNSQTFNSSIDIYVPFANADAAFTESNYGVVAVQHSIPNSSRTFCFSYSLSNLNDGEMPNTREELLQRILNYFDIYSVVPDVGKITTLSCSVYPNPFSHTTLIGYQVDENTLVTLTIFNHLGQQVAALVEAAQTKGKYQIEWNAENLPSGVYYCRLKTGNQLISKKIIKMN
jgi:PKD repeat protein